MEKNGAISRDTPCCGGGCRRMNKAGEDKPENQLTLFPETEEEASTIDTDLTKKAIEEVAKRSKVL